MRSETPRLVGPNISFAFEIPGDSLASSSPSIRKAKTSRRSRPVRGLGMRYRNPFGKGWITI